MRRGKPLSLLVRNLRCTTSPDDLRKFFEKFGNVRDVYLPLDYYSKLPRGFGFVEYSRAEDAESALEYLSHHATLDGNEISVTIAQQGRKSPETMKHRENSNRYYREGVKKEVPTSFRRSNSSFSNHYAGMHLRKRYKHDKSHIRANHRSSRSRSLYRCEPSCCHRYVPNYYSSYDPYYRRREHGDYYYHHHGYRSFSPPPSSPSYDRYYNVRKSGYVSSRPPYRISPYARPSYTKKFVKDSRYSPVLKRRHRCLSHFKLPLNNPSAEQVTSKQQLSFEHEKTDENLKNNTLHTDKSNDSPKNSAEPFNHESTVKKNAENKDEEQNGIAE